jgi:hypothetical protein
MTTRRIRWTTCAKAGCAGFRLPGGKCLAQASWAVQRWALRQVQHGRRLDLPCEQRVDGQIAASSLYRRQRQSITTSGAGDPSGDQAIRVIWTSVNSPEMAGFGTNLYCVVA